MGRNMVWGVSVGRVGEVGMECMWVEGREVRGMEWDEERKGGKAAAGDVVLGDASLRL